jgi:hypothetical protein
MLLLTLVSQAHAGAIGLGVALGSPTGGTLSAYLTNRSNLDFLVGETWYDGWPRNEVLFSADYDYHLVDAFETDTGRMDFYIGGGVNVWIQPYGADLAGEMPVGFAFFFADAPVELYAEVCPMLLVLPFPSFALGGSLGARYYFRARGE